MRGDPGACQPGNTHHFTAGSGFSLPFSLWPEPDLNLGVGTALGKRRCEGFTRGQVLTLQALGPQDSLVTFSALRESPEDALSGWSAP